MCGVFGFVAKNDAAPDLAVLKALARVTETRGRHAFGFSWIDSKGRLKMYKQTGKITDALGLLTMAKDARMLIGHCRWATQGSPANNLNNHPHPADGGWIVHNGVIPNYDGAIEDFRLNPVSECDSELIGLLIERLDGPIVRRVADAATIADDNPLVVAGLWNRPNRLVLIRRGNPLSVGSTDGGHYFASLITGLPGKARQVPDNTALEFTGRKVHKSVV